MQLKYINLDEIYNILSTKDFMLSQKLQEEFSFIPDLSSADDYYIFADLIISRKSRNNWAVYSDATDENFFVNLSNPNKDLKPSVLKALNEDYSLYEFKQNQIKVIN